jgi:hypothetical protein
MSEDEPLKQLVGRVIERHGADFDHWFPASFDWRGACSDAAGMAERAGSKRPLSDEGRAALAAAAGEHFRLGYLAGLLVLAAHDPHDPDPEGLVAQLVEPLDDEEEELFGALVVDHMDAIEARLAGGEQAHPPGTERIVRYAERAWAPLATWFAASPRNQRTPWRPFLLAFGRLGAGLAALRWALDGRR